MRQKRFVYKRVETVRKGQKLVKIMRVNSNRIQQESRYGKKRI